MPSQLFNSSEYQRVEVAVKNLLNAHEEDMGALGVRSPRAAGDAIQDILGRNFAALLGEMCKEYSAAFARRAMADFAFKDKDDFYYVVDVKTHRKEMGFHMPNLTSVERLARFYEDDTNYFTVLSISYRIERARIVVEEVHFVPIEFLAWKSLTIGALGWGQIQIKNMDMIDIIPAYPRKSWMIQLCETLFEFYPREIDKISHRIDYFKRVRDYWAGKA